MLNLLNNKDLHSLLFNILLSFTHFTHVLNTFVKYRDNNLFYCMSLPQESTLRELLTQILIIKWILNYCLG